MIFIIYNIIYIVLVLAPIFAFTHLWRVPSWVKNSFLHIIWRGVWGILITLWYGIGPFIVYTLTNFNPRILPKSDTAMQGLPNDIFIAIFVALTAIFIALASLEATYVNRLSDIINEQNKDPGKEIINKSLLSAYYLITYGFWAFSFAVLVTLGLLGTHFYYSCPNAETVEICSVYEAKIAAYEAAIALLMVIGWLLLIGGALSKPIKPKVALSNSKDVLKDQHILFKKTKIRS